MSEVRRTGDIRHIPFLVLFAVFVDAMLSLTHDATRQNSLVAIIALFNVVLSIYYMYAYYINTREKVSSR